MPSDHSRALLTRVLPLAGAVVVLDQVTKAFAIAGLAPGMPVVLTDWLALTLVMNTGLAFGLLAGLPSAWRWLVGVLSLLALVVLARVAVRALPTGGRAVHVAIGLIFGGAVGNLIDRIRWGAVIDFVDVHWRDYHWPAFNVADSAITVGVALLAVRLMTQPPAALTEHTPRR